MNNEVYIDGVNVAECKFFIEEYIEDFPDDNGVRIERFCAIEQKQCHDKINCYFKQLQRAKAEFEQYKKSKQASYEVMQAEWNNAVNELRDVRAENDTLHITISKLKADLSQAETSLYAWKVENEKLKKRLENKEKAYNHLCNANARKKEQIKNLNYMLFEEKDMTTQEWKLKYRLANKERKFIQYKEITNKRLNNYKQTLEEVKKYCNECNLKADYTACEVLKVINEVLNI